uniref:InlB B-repeat-containing protein n=1 Tax=Pleomorphovibrio marinus TaxID=2164132 RepID=UPI0013002FD2
ASAGWIFNSWTDGEGEELGTETTLQVTMDSDKTVRAVFTEIPAEYELTVEIDGEGMVFLDPDNATYEVGTLVELTAVASLGWVFDRWENDLSGSENPERLVMDSNKTVTAVFVLEQTEGDEGCSLGFWKNSDNWCSAYDAKDNFFTVFGITNTRKLGRKGYLSLRDGLSQGGGGYSKLTRQAIAALLNACNQGVNYPYSTSEIIAEVQTVFNDRKKTKSDANMLGDKYDEANNAGCPLNNSKSQGKGNSKSSDKGSSKSSDKGKVKAKFESTTKLKVYPNKLQGHGIWVKFTEVENSEVYSAVVYGFNGKPIATTSFNVKPGSSDHFWDINHRNWREGVYILKVSNNKEEFSIRLLKN